MMCLIQAHFIFHFVFSFLSRIAVFCAQGFPLNFLPPVFFLIIAVFFLPFFFITNEIMHVSVRYLVVCKCAFSFTPGGCPVGAESWYQVS